MINEIKVYKVAKLAIIGQLVFLFVGILVVSFWGTVPAEVVDYYKQSQESPWKTFFIDDTYNIILICFYVPSMIGIFMATKDKQATLGMFSLIAVLISVIIILGAHSGITMMNLSKAYYSTSDMAAKEQLLAAGRAILAGNMWQSSAGFYSGILMQGGAFLLTITMISGKSFSKVTILAGLLCNGGDLINHLIHYDLPDVAKVFLMFAGPFYMIWYVSMIIDFSKLIKRKQLSNA